MTKRFLNFRRGGGAGGSPLASLAAGDVKANASLDPAIASRPEFQSAIRQLYDLQQKTSEVVRQLEDQVARAERRLDLLMFRNSVLEELAKAERQCKQFIADRFHFPIPPDYVLEGGRPPRFWRAENVTAEVKRSGLFDPEWYRRRYALPNTMSDEQALERFVKEGLYRGEDPSVLFSTYWYTKMNQPPQDKLVPPFLSFIRGDVHATSHPLFDPDYYLSRYNDIKDLGLSPLSHFVQFGARERRWPHPAFDPDWYSVGRGDQLGRANPLIDYLTEPGAASTSPHPLFDPAHYCGGADQIRRLGQPPLLHYMTVGVAEGRNPHPLFNGSWYLTVNRDVVGAKINPLTHYLRYGGRERRPVHPLFSSQAYLTQWPEPDLIDNPLVHYVTQGARLDRSPSPAFPEMAFREAFPDYDPAAGSAAERLLSANGLSPKVERRSLSILVSKRDGDAGAPSGGVAARYPDTGHPDANG